MRSLFLNGAHVTDAGLKRFVEQQHDGLSDVMTDDTAITDAGRALLWENFPNCDPINVN